ncbi:hypothetical protein CCR97_08990 [Rhodoplanes elegans]|uniref:Cupin 2 conserved barrel domain-containing protein n=1 Tax=Rhodoplanes elegans TaxID=29408 RepID=A0A327KVL6_9BRAD|nr:cupin [Rhodoplanes elegans]MBK5958346.1 hypothetical protein [Rhodoplanes elegans]RAI39388.1 hypothetical protein CH338_09580 [Rhodoplanes elegans]
MTDRHGLQLAAERGLTLDDVGSTILLDNAHVRIWEVKIAPGETLGWHIHYHPYVVIAVTGGRNEIETIFGERRATYEPPGHVVLIDGMRPIHRLTNRDKTTYLARLIELKHIRWIPETAPLPSLERPDTE